MAAGGHTCFHRFINGRYDSVTIFTIASIGNAPALTPSYGAMEAVAGADVVVATPGRLNDFLAPPPGFSAPVRATHAKYVVLDEADRMLDMGFIHDIKKIIKQTPNERQTLFFSATMPPNIRELSSTILKEPIRVQIAAESSAAETVDQKVYYVRQNDKKDLLVYILGTDEISNALVFTRTKFGADKVVRHLQRNDIKAEAIHGNKSQPAREKALKDINSKKEILDKQINEEISNAEKEIEALKKSAAEKINKIAIETSSDLVKKLIGAEVNSSSISAIVEDILKRNGSKYYGS